MLNQYRIALLVVIITCTLTVAYMVHMTRVAQQAETAAYAQGYMQAGIDHANNCKFFTAHFGKQDGCE